MKVLVTGAAGYIGTKLCNLLCQLGYSVVGIDNFRYGNEKCVLHLFDNPKFVCIRVDVRDVASYHRDLIDADVIIPLAALVGEPICKHNYLEAHQVNYEAIKSMSQFISNGQKVIYPNTNSGYGIKSEGWCTEESPLTPISHYGLTKCNSEKLILDRGGTSLRLATVCGVSPRMRMDLMVNSFAADILYSFNHFKKFKVFEPQFKRNFVYIDDVCSAFVWALEKNLSGVYNVGNPRSNMTKMELAKRICYFYNIPESMIEVGEGSDPDKRDYLVSNDKIISTGFQFQSELEHALSDIESIMEIFKYEDLIKMRNI